MPTRRTLIAGGVIVLFAAAGILAQQPVPEPLTQQPPVTFRLEVNYVEIDAVVTDEEGNLVEDLTLEDFEVLEDGEVQEVTAFSQVNIPVEQAMRPLFAESPIEPDVHSNERAFDGRVFVLTLDDLHTAPLRTSRVITAAKEFIEHHLGANDLTSVVFTSGRSDAAQDFTSNRRLLLAAVDKFMGQGIRSSVLGQTEMLYRTLGQDPQNPINVPGQMSGIRTGPGPVTDELDFERGQKARSTLSLLRDLTEWLGGIRGRRKAVVYLSEGIDYDIYDFFNGRYATTIAREMRETIAAATQANVAFYTLDPRGLVSVGVDVETSLIPDDLSTGRMTGFSSYSQLRDNLRLAQDSLRVLADQTGGMSFLDSNDFTDAFSRIVRDNSSYYVLGYYASNDRRDGGFRRIEVRVNRPGVTVRSRNGYQAPSGTPPKIELADASEGTSQELREVMATPLPVSGLTLRTSALPFTGERPDAAVVVMVELDGRDLSFSERDGLFEDTVELTMMLIDSGGKIRGGENRSLKLKLKPENHEIVSRYGLRVVSRFDVKPGRYQVRLAARESGAGRSGSIGYDVEVPDFSEGKLLMSGLAITSAGASRTPTAKADPYFEDVLPAQPTTVREFSSEDEIFLFVEVYDNETKVSHKVDITSTVRTDEGRVVFRTDEERSSTELQGARGGYGHVTSISLRDLTPGIYVLRTEARSRLDQESLVFRQLQFRVVNSRAASGLPE